MNRFCVFCALLCTVLAGLAGRGLAAEPAPVVMRTAMASNENPFQAGKAAAETLKQRLGGLTPHVVLLADCFEDKANKEQVLKGAGSVLGAEKIVGGAFYGMFSQDGVMDSDAVALLGIAGEGVTVATALEEHLGAAGLTLEKDQPQLAAALNAAGRRLAGKLPGAADARLMLLVSDAHSPKNQLLLDGVQAVVGKKLPITGASVNKNAGQNWVYYHGALYTDSAVAVVLRGPMTTAAAGRQAKDNDRVIATAGEGVAAAAKQLGHPGFAVLAFDCAGRKGKLKNLGDELAAIQAAAGNEVVLFGCYGAGEYGPADMEDVADKTVPHGCGWHVMFTALGQ